CYFQNCPKG
nr:Chain B, Lys Vasopressin [synthetic construct]prf//0909223C vasopressin,Lys [Setonix brachyurus]prf//520042A vasopressin,Lys [Sus scrofa domesticus]prf//530011A vasopressin,Lys [Bos taurus]prf//681070B vasopressin,Lys [Mus musculus]prf//610024A vasopressin,Lys [Sus scrofa domesticus]